METTNDIIASSPDCEIVNKRIINVPSQIIFNAFANPNHLKNWWGPNGFTNTFHEFDFKPGGKWRFTMHGPEKGNYENECEFIAMSQQFITWQRISQPIFKMAIQLNKLPENKTEIIFKMIFDTKEACDKLRKFVPEKNEENLDRLEAELKTMI